VKGVEGSFRQEEMKEMKKEMKKIFKEILYIKPHSRPFIKAV
jgi:hypothetical protein